MQISILMMTAFPESAAVTIDMNFQKRQPVFADLGYSFTIQPPSQIQIPILSSPCGNQSSR